jgi:predicted dehydrogenase
MQRRKFLTATAAATTAGLFTKTRSAAAIETVEAAKKYRVGLIGTGWYGKVDLFRLLAVAGDEVEVVGLCDVDKNMLAEAAKLTAQRQQSGKQPALYADYRKLLAEQMLDIAIIGTPDHWHALPMIEACQSGCDVYVQKPVGVDFVEGEAMVAAARKYDRVVQVGMQRRSTPHLLEARDKYIASGRIGKIGRVEIYSYYGRRHGLAEKIIQPPENLDFDRWTGPAPLRPYYENMLPIKWRAFSEYGNGAIGDLCVHFFDLARYFLDLGWPQEISCIGGEFVDTENPSTIPDTQDAIFKYPGLNVAWTNRAWGNPVDKDYPWAISFYGSKGTLRMNLQRYDFTPTGGGQKEKGEFLAEEFSKLEREEQRFDLATLGATRRHLKNFFDAVKSRELPVADILEGHISSSACVLANTAMDLGRTLTLDPQTGRPINDPEATQRLARDYRQPWVHPTAESV